MPRRRKAVPCLLCKADTWDGDAICMDCRRAYQVGKEVVGKREEARGLGEKIRIGLPNYARFTPSSHDGDLPHSTNDANSQLWRLLIDLFGLERLERYADPDRKVGFAPGQDAYSSESMYFLATPADADRIDAIVKLIRTLAAANYRDGYRSGNDMIGRLASGDLTVNQLTKLK